MLDDNFKTMTEFVLRNPCLYGDFRTAMEESEPRLYEDIQDYDAAKALFQEVCRMKVIRVTPEFRISRLTFYRKSASKC